MERKGEQTTAKKVELTGQRRKLTRREFLKGFALAAAGLALSACGVEWKNTKTENLPADLVKEIERTAEIYQTIRKKVNDEITAATLAQAAIYGDVEIEQILAANEQLIKTGLLGKDLRNNALFTSLPYILGQEVNPQKLKEITPQIRKRLGSFVDEKWVILYSALAVANNFEPSLVMDRRQEVVRLSTPHQVEAVLTSINLTKENPEEIKEMYNKLSGKSLYPEKLAILVLATSLTDDNNLEDVYKMSEEIVKYDLVYLLSTKSNPKTPEAKTAEISEAKTIEGVLTLSHILNKKRGIEDPEKTIAMYKLMIQKSGADPTVAARLLLGTVSHEVGVQIITVQPEIEIGTGKNKSCYYPIVPLLLGISKKN